MDAIEILAGLSTPEGRADPYPLYAKLHEIGEVIPAGPGLVLVVGYDAIDSVLRDPGFRVCDEFLFDSQIPNWRESPAYVQAADWLLTMNDPRHARIRCLLARAFTARRIARLEPVIVKAADELLDAMADRGADGSPVEFMHDFAYLLPVTVMCDLIGIPKEDREVFRPLARGLSGILELSDVEALPEVNAAAAQALDYFTKLAAKRRADPRDDLLSSLLAISDSDPSRLTSAELLHTLTMLVVGFETLTNLLGSGLHIVLQHPRAGAAVRDGSVRPQAFMEEVLRFEPPVQYSWRIGYDTSVGGVPVSGRTMLMILFAAGNRDPRKFADPARFDPSRPAEGLLSFSGGAHFCLGAGLARQEGAVAFPRLLNRFPDIRAAGEPTRPNRLFLRGFDTLPVTIATPAAHPQDEMALAGHL
jgi:cytochrome P450